MSSSLAASLISIMIILLSPIFASAALRGSWKMLHESVGVSAMHMQLLHNDRVILFDNINWDRSNISLPQGSSCRARPGGWYDCTAHSVEYNVLEDTYRPLTLLTDTWCSSGAVDSNGQLMQTGGFEEGSQVIRLFTPCNSSSCDWVELKNGKLLRPRWYSTNHILPNGQSIIVGGIGQPNYEFYPKTTLTKDLFHLSFLEDTSDGNGVLNNLYPFIFLNTDGNLFIFANNRSILLDYTKNKVVRQDYPIMPNGNPRSYPSTGSAVLLALKDLESPIVKAEVFICGGAPRSAYVKASNDEFLTALNTCGRMKINDPLPKWEMETMPMPRVMGDMLLLPNQQVLIINGCEMGSAGFGLARNAQQSPIIYKPDSPSSSSRFDVQNPSNVPRVYHSTSILLRDGRVLVGGSNTNGGYIFQNVMFPTQLSLEVFQPEYLDPSFTNLRPNIVFTPPAVNHGVVFRVRFKVKAGLPNAKNLKVTIIRPPFNTHSFSQGQRMLVLTLVDVPTIVPHLSDSTFQVRVKSPVSGILAPSGYYMLFVVNQDVPSEGIWMRIRP